MNYKECSMLYTLPEAQSAHEYLTSATHGHMWQDLWSCWWWGWTRASCCHVFVLHVISVTPSTAPGVTSCLLSRRTPDCMTDDPEGKGPLSSGKAVDTRDFYLITVYDVSVTHDRLLTGDSHPDYKVRLCVNLACCLSFVFGRLILFVPAILTDCYTGTYL